jgi:hypothetical protein
MAGITRRETEVLEELMQGEFFQQKEELSSEGDQKESHKVDAISNQNLKAEDDCNLVIAQAFNLASDQNGNFSNELESLMQLELFIEHRQPSTTGLTSSIAKSKEVSPKVKAQPGNPYIYKPIAGSSVIRTLCLNSGTGSEPLKGSIQHILLSKNKGYEAVSYVWGSSERPHRLLLDDGVMEITQSV